MKRVISGEIIPIKMWLDHMEQEAIDQAKNLAKLPFAYKHVAIMPDAHVGYGMPIGGVLATEGVVIPNAVGVDIGCGMCSLSTSIRSEEIPSINFSKLIDLIQKRIPTGFDHHKEKQDKKWMPAEKSDLPKNGKILSEIESAKKQVGTLGGGNHFIEIQEGDNGFVWIMIHSGSRNLGYKTAAHHNQIAKKMNDKYWSRVLPAWDLAFLPIDSQEGVDYMNEMNYAIEFALMNRLLMMECVKECLVDVIKDVQFDTVINKPHNFAAWENHFGKNVIIHRKGACRARDGEIGMIPGSQGTSSFIVLGKGEKMSFSSCSHGAGRLMSRSKARKELSLEEEQQRLNALGIHHTMETEQQLDEAPSAYKDIHEVMANQTDLVDILVTLRPLAVVKA